MVLAALFILAQLWGWGVIDWCLSGFVWLWRKAMHWFRKVPTQRWHHFWFGKPSGVDKSLYWSKAEIVLAVVLIILEIVYYSPE